jgi:hypothetical protein
MNNNFTAKAQSRKEPHAKNYKGFSLRNLCAFAPLR